MFNKVIEIWRRFLPDRFDTSKIINLELDYGKPIIM
jgi:hypothetical protein